ncbi:MAG: DUF1489 domain-containing protein [Proteobacteria bacterium]|nr:DUF1489 domain-containing protein [Pseudomonadota bacterium]
MNSDSLHLIKLAVGIENAGHLATVQERRLAESLAAGHGARLFHVTRNVPRRAAELLDGGSIYWVIKGRIRVRQRLLDIENDTDDEGRRYCRLMLDPERVATRPWPHRAIQGWRYLPAETAPPDLARLEGDGRLPPELAAELRDLGLL